MSQDQLNRSLPFLTRDMLAFEHGTTFSLRISSTATAASAITIRGITREGAFTLTHIPNSDGSEKIETFRIPDVPIYLSVFDTANNFLEAGTWCSLHLVINDDLVIQLCAGSVASRVGISWPLTNVQSPREGVGKLKNVAGANPAAGAECSITVPTGRIWHVLGASVTLVTDGTGANRRPHFLFNHDASIAIETFPLVDQTATQTIRYSVAAHGAIPDELDNSVVRVNMPENVWLTPGSTITTVTTNLQAGDNYGVPTAIVEEFWSVEP